MKTVHQLESRMREIRLSGLAGGEAGINRPSLPRSWGRPPRQPISSIAQALSINRANLTLACRVSSR